MKIAIIILLLLVVILSIYNYFIIYNYFQAKEKDYLNSLTFKKKLICKNVLIILMSLTSY